MALWAAYDRCRTQLGRECYPRGNCVASELGKEQTVGQKMVLKNVSLVLVGSDNDGEQHADEDGDKARQGRLVAQGAAFLYDGEGDVYEGAGYKGYKIEDILLEQADTYCIADEHAQGCEE